MLFKRSNSSFEGACCTSRISTIEQKFCPFIRQNTPLTQIWSSDYQPWKNIRVNTMSTNVETLHHFCDCYYYENVKNPLFAISRCKFNRVTQRSGLPYTPSKFYGDFFDSQNAYTYSSFFSNNKKQGTWKVEKTTFSLQ